MYIVRVILSSLIHCVRKILRFLMLQQLVHTLNNELYMIHTLTELHRNQTPNSPTEKCQE